MEQIKQRIDNYFLSKKHATLFKPCKDTLESKAMQGGCFCGNIRYEIGDGEYLVANCHCTMCRKTSAAPFVTWVVVPTESFRYIQGSAKLLQSSDKGRRYFCEECGTPLVFLAEERPTVIDITTGSLDDPERYIPTKDVHEESRLKWLHLNND
ncbi:MAG: aldehyde-activating protein [SAR86 cluster bacterium]|uniref:Aldehyde-activating protein n=1 Tax=SAR86 cluster bacterium TaxID=2030880 RepID=A0A2A5ARX3_9GAMM|nr:MAG: aldehyde-activating protein [SAR86 cluster bacterium]